ncbi:MAG: type IV pilin protein [Gammaproteobacteria bacterium]
MHTRHHRPALRASRAMRGITLLELMIVLVIVGILAAVGYPAYVKYTDRARRADGKALLTDAAARMERFYYDRNQYTTNLGELGYGGSPVYSAERRYVLSAEAGPTGSIQTSYLLTATPNPDSSHPGHFDDTDCGALTLDSRGTQGAALGTVDDCWGR